MKRILTALFVLTVLALTVGAASTPLRFGTKEEVYSIDASYTVAEADVQTITVMFGESLTNAYANFTKGILKIAIASADPLDLTTAVGTAQATMPDGSVIAPTLELKSLRFNGKNAVSSFVLASVEAKWQDGQLDVTLTASEYNPSNSYGVIVAAYDADGRLIAASMQTLTFDAKTAIKTYPIACGKTVSIVKVFSLNDAWQPNTDCIEAMVDMQA